MTKQNKIYLIGIGGIGVSAIARYYLSEGWKVFGSDKNDSQLIHALQKEGCDIIVGSDSSRIDESFDLIVHTEAIPTPQEELEKAKNLGLKIEKYNESLANIANSKKLIAVSGTHGKSTTTSLISLILKDSNEHFYSVIGTILKEFGGKNFFQRKTEKENENYFAIEACEYKEHFLEYTPTVLVVTNIEFDHADYFKTPERYFQAFEKMIQKVIPGGFVIFSEEDTNAQKLVGVRDDVHFIGVTQTTFTAGGEVFSFPEIEMKVPGEHILLDAKIAYVVGHLMGISDESILQTLSAYSGVWRRMEIIGNTEYGNILMSDYGHHPTEISVTLKALREGYPDKKLFVIFQPHQYSRTLELLEGFQNCFSGADTLIIPNIYESRDSEENKKKISTEKLVESIHHTNIFDGKGLENTLKMIEEYEKEHPNSSILLLQGAGDVDNLRFKIKTS